MASISLSDITSSSVLCHVIGLDTNYSRNDRTIEWFYDDTLFREDDLSPGVSESGGCRITGLRSGTTYTIRADIHYSDDNNLPQTKTLTTSFTTEEETAVRPDSFEWTYPKTSGGTFNLTATEWNDLCANINEVREYKGLSTKSFTRARKGDEFTASMFNQCLNAIANMNSSLKVSCWEVSSGDVVEAASLNALVSYLNGVN